MKKLVGVYHVLSVLPVWATAGILFIVTQVVILVGRDILEGMPYQVSYSAMLGDAGFIIIVLIVAEGFRECQPEVPKWLQSGVVHARILAASVIIGAVVSILTLGSRSGQAMDVYHDVIVAPLFLYFAVTLLPVIYKNGTRLEMTATVCLILLWVMLVVFDVMHDRMNQREWIVQQARDGIFLYFQR